MSKWKKWLLPAGVLLASTGAALAQDAEAAEAVAEAAAAAEEVFEQGVFVANNVWMMVATFLVFIMHLGFATLEAGLTRAKNTVNILFKNTGIISIGLLTYTLIGFNMMYPGEFLAGGWVPKITGASFGIATDAAGLTPAYADGGYTYWTDFLFQGMFAATAATIVSGAVAERIKLESFLVFSLLYVGIVYPFSGSWKWGGGALDAAGFYDFAGSTIVHSVGGWAALVGAIILGPRLGKYNGSSITPIPGHNMPLATIGVFLLWLGWFGFNGGSVLSADPALTSFVLVTTSLAAAAGIVGAMAASWTVQKKPDLSMVLNGSLAGLVGITAGADVVTVAQSIGIGFVAGIIVVLSVIAIDKAKIDDPVGAISVHLVCGIFGTLCAAFGEDVTIVAQLKGILVTAVFCVVTSGILFLAIKAIMGLRVSEEEEQTGLDIGEHGMEAYSGFQIFTQQ